MKICPHPFMYLYLDKFDGTVWLCPWMHREHGIIGNVLEIAPMDIWKGEKAAKVRQAFRQGEGLTMCRTDACPLLQNGTVPDIEGAAFDVMTTTSEYPELINLAHDYFCNQSCETCRPFKFRPPKDYQQKIKTINSKIIPFLDNAKKITLSGHGDPFASPNMMNLMQNLRPSSPRFAIQLETNGVYFDKKHWERIAHLAEYSCSVIVTVNSYDPFTYAHINRGGIFKKLMENLEFLKKLRQRNDIKKLDIAMVIQDRNFREMPSFIERSYEQYECDTVYLRPVYQWGTTMPPDVFWFKDVLNPMHPYHAEYLELLDHPSMNKPYVYNFGGRTLHPANPFPGHSIQA